MTRDELIVQVALRMDEITPEEDLVIAVGEADNNPLYALIDGIADDAALELYSVAPYWRLPQTAFEEANIKVTPITGDADSRKIIRLRLGDDFLRVAEISCVDFQRPITEVAVEQSPEGRRQHNRFLMGKEAKPVGVLSFGMWQQESHGQMVNVKCREIDCYSLSYDTTVTPSLGVVASYIAKPGAAEDVPEILVPALEWLVAARAFGARGDVNHAQICQQNAQNLLV